MKTPSILKKIKKLVVGKIPIDINVRDIIIAQAMPTKEAQIKSNQLKNKIIKNFVGNKISLIINAKDAPKYVFQEILYKFHQNNPKTLLIIGGYIDVKLTHEDIEIYKAQNKTPPPTKKILRIFFGSTHKPFDEDFHKKIDIPCDTNNEPIIDKLTIIKINEMFNYFNLFCDNTKVVSGNIENRTKSKQDKLLLYFILDKKDESISSREVQRNIHLVTDDEIRNVFDALVIFEKINKKTTLSISLSISAIIIVYQLFLQLNTDNVDQMKQNSVQVKRINQQTLIAKRELFALEDSFEHKKKMISNEMKIYKGK